MISIIMSTYNEKIEWIKESIESILNQTYKDFEFLITIDKPENGELIKLVQEYAQKDARINVIINKENKGLIWSLNNMLSIAKGEYIARMDADDISLPERLEKQLNYIEEKNVDFIGSNTINFNDNNTYKTSLFLNDYDIKENLYNGAFIPHPTWFVKKEVYIELKGYRNIYAAEDYDFFLRAIKHGFLVSNIKEPLLKYRMNLNGISKSNALKQKLTSKYLLDNFEKVDKITYDMIVEHINPFLLESEKYAKGELIYNKIKSTRNIFVKLLNLFILIINYNVFLKYNTYNNVKNKVAFRYNLKNQQLGIRIKHYIKLFVYPLIKKKIINKNILAEKNVYLVDVPQFRNLGDHAIAYAEKNFFEKNFPEYNIIEIPIDEFETNFFSICKNAKASDVIVLVGGGNFGIEYYILELHRRELIKRCKSKIVLFPQTIYFGYSYFGLKQLMHSKKIYSANQNLILFAREKKSYNIMKYYFNNKSYLSPDIVLSLKLKPNKKDRNNILLCLRNDVESNINGFIKEELIGYLNNNQINYDTYDTVLDHNVLLKNRNQELLNSFNKFNSYKLVITDRLHGMIFSSITNTPCIVLKNYNYKVDGVYNSWLKNIPYIKLINDEKKIIKEILSLYSNKNLDYNYSEFNNLLDKDFDIFYNIVKEFLNEKIY